MRVASRVLLALLLAVVLLGGAAGQAVASDATADSEAAVLAAQDAAQTEPPDTLNVTQEFQLAPSRSGEVVVRVHYDVPNPVVGLRTAPPTDAEILDAAGFEAGNDGQYHWDESTTTPSLTYALPVNESLADDTPHGASGSKVSVDAGSWAMFQRPLTNTRYDHTGPVGYELHRTTAGPGQTGEWLVFLGDHERHERNAHGQDFTLVVPENANTTDSPETILDSLGQAAGSLQVDERNDEVFVVAAPTDGVSWGVRGAHVGESDMWVRDSEPLADPDSAWLHEYVHSRQGYSLSPEMRWFHEASASYYAAVLAYEQGHVEYETVEKRLAAGTNPEYDDVVLANQSTWEHHADYDRGALVAADIDRQIRLASDGNHSLQSVFSAMNEPSGQTSLAAFTDLVAEYGNESVAEASEEQLTTTANVSTWNESVHVESHGPYPPNVSYEIHGSGENSSHLITGPYRTAVITEGDPVVLVPGEQLYVDVDVANTGGSPGAYNASLVVNGATTDSATGTVAKNETTTARLAHTFDSTGGYDLRVGDQRLDVFVTEPARVETELFRATTGTVTQGETVSITGTVRNDAPIPANDTLTVTKNGETVGTETVRLGPDSTETIFTSVAVHTPGETVIAFDGQQSVTVQVEERATPDADSVSNGSDPGDANSTATPAATANSNATATTTPAANGSGPVSGAGSTWFGSGTAVLAVLAALGLFVRLRN